MGASIWPRQEAISDVIHSRTELALRAANEQTRRETLPKD
jgi:hypothetical protein